MVDINKDFVPIHEVQDIADSIVKQHNCLISSERIIVGIAGRPGSGSQLLLLSR